jgi:hypothetical protein
MRRDLNRLRKAELMALLLDLEAELAEAKQTINRLSAELRGLRMRNDQLLAQVKERP